MDLGSRNYVLQRRTAGIADMSALTPQTGGLSIEEAERDGIYRINCAHQVGLATATEAGLPAHRFPVRVILNAVGRKASQVDTVVKYWKVVNASGHYLNFQRKPLASDLPIRNLYKLIPDIDDRLFDAWGQIREGQFTEDLDVGIANLTDEMYAILCLVNPTDAQKARATEICLAVIQTCTEAHRVSYFKISGDYFIKGKPHGCTWAQIGGMSANKVALVEATLTMLMNYNRFRTRYAQLSDGSITVASYAVASMFRLGLYEAYEGKEFYTVVCAPVEGSGTNYQVVEILAPTGAPNPTDLAVGSQVDIGPVRISPQMAEFGSLLVATAGNMHYLFNHTTGGTIMSGSLLSTLAMYKLVTSDMSQATQEDLTSLFYEALHPANKRAVANLFYKTSMVTTHGRERGSPMFELLRTDSYATIRGNPFPAGSHKAFICITALRRVLQAGLGPFLPWASNLSECVNICKSVLSNGARAHIGSNYYTGEPALVQPSSIDQYLPELAHYVHTFNKGDSLAMSPHMSFENAQRCDMNWKNLLKDLKSKDVSAVSAEVVRNFLSTVGVVHYAFDPADQSTWALAAATSTEAMTAVNELFN